MPPDLLEALLEALELQQQDARQLALAWARVAPTVAIVPAFGLRAVPVATRAALGLVLALALPAGAVGAHPEWPWGVQLLAEAWTGLPVAISAAVAIWVATMAGGVVDNLRQARETAELPHVDPGSTPMGALLGMFAALAFLQGGGPERVVAALGRVGAPDRSAVEALVVQLSSGIEVAVAVAAPIVAASMIVEVASALIARAANPAFVQPIFAPLRSLALLAVAALVFDRMAEALFRFAQAFP